jgi:hypothetical protein
MDRRLVEHRVLDVRHEHVRRRPPQRLVHHYSADLGADSRISETLRAQIGR